MLSKPSKIFLVDDDLFCLYVVGQVVIWLKHTRRGHIVLYDRYYFNFINDGRRSNISLPTRPLYPGALRVRQ